VRQHQPPAGPYLPALTAWQSLSQASSTLVTQAQRVMAPASWLLSLLAVASVAVVAGTRMAAQGKRVGLLKAVGGTPSLAAAVLLAGHLVVALAGAACGLAIGWLTAPLLSSPGASLLGAPGAPALGPATILLVPAAGIAVAVVATAIPALRAARISTVTALADTARPPRRTAWLIKVSSWLPAPLLLGVRMLMRRPRRVLLSTASFTVTATAIVAVMTFHATMSQEITLPGPYTGPPDPGHGRVSQILLVVTVVLAVLAAANAIVTTWATILDTRRYWATARALGTTPRQVIAGLSAAQAMPALAGALLGIPAGTELYALVQGAGYRASPPSWWLLAMVAGMLLAAVSLTAVPARIGVRRSVSEILQAEAT
jgi:putative ABC transport system permease protein